jgi:hypothetical protein
MTLTSLHCQKIVPFVVLAFLFRFITLDSLSACPLHSANVCFCRICFYSPKCLDSFYTRSAASRRRNVFSVDAILGMCCLG